MRASKARVDALGKQDEHDLSRREEHFTRVVGTFFDDLIEASIRCARIDNGTLNPAALRESVGRGTSRCSARTSRCCYSETMIRALAGAWHELQNPTAPRVKKG